ncbi:MAG: 30S ribosomal protein S8e [Nitrososphaerales archaeon]|uniref:Ribosomal protein S8e (RP-S8e, RPS8) n=2 Tax=environmental samples TaxID=651140 RepID=A0A075HA98_9ARCH|nr:ribosomal protein s8e (RP-S8e, RPS8) [uncultured marine thaumarchaeote AD1000_38_A02]AIF10688.1 ribosomal protein S8e (RP-S8e, RPS8) [uncultured marine thaumarchaeote KM3_46_H07]|tara:strand:- start:1519 stop:1905 length:387 start_codon:yes stop_codon:yes gene_type:complete
MVKSLENIRKRKHTGGLIKHTRSRRSDEKDSFSVDTLLGDHSIRVKNSRGGNIKVSLVSDNSVNVIDKSNNSIKKVAITRVLKNPSNRDYERRRVITRGAILDTELGKVRVLSRPGQSGIINGILISE